MTLNVFFLPDSDRPQRQRPFELLERPVDDLLLEILERDLWRREPRIMIEKKIALVPNVLLPGFLHFVSDLPTDDLERRVVDHDDLAEKIRKRLDVDLGILQFHPMFPLIQRFSTNPRQEPSPQLIVLAHPINDLRFSFQDAPDVIFATHSSVYNYGSISSLQEPVIEVLEDHNVGGCPGIGPHHDGKALSLSDPQALLEELSDFAVFSSPRPLGQAPAFEIRIRDVNDRRMVFCFVFPQPFQDMVFDPAEIHAAEMAKGLVQSADRNLFESQKLRDLRAAEPFLQLPDARPLQKMGIDKRQDIGAVFGEQLLQAQSFCYPVDGQNIGAMADGFDFDVGRGHTSLDMAINLFSDIADMLLDNLALDPGVFDLGKIDRITPFDFSYEAYGVYTPRTELSRAEDLRSD